MARLYNQTTSSTAMRAAQKSCEDHMRPPDRRLRTPELRFLVWSRHSNRTARLDGLKRKRGRGRKRVSKSKATRSSDVVFPHVGRQTLKYCGRRPISFSLGPFAIPINYPWQQGVDDPRSSRVVACDTKCEARKKMLYFYKTTCEPWKLNSTVPRLWVGRTGFDFSRDKNFSFCHRAQNSSWKTHRLLFSGYRGSCLGGKAAGEWSCADIKNVWRWISTLSYTECPN
jgi:hypothetical protein